MKEIKFSSYGYESLNVYRLAFTLAMEIFEVSKTFPKEEQYSLTGQIRRSSRSVCANIAEGYRKRVYPKSFAAKVVDADSECSETRVHLQFAKECGYLSEMHWNSLIDRYEEIGKMLGSIINKPQRFLPIHEI